MSGTPKGYGGPANCALGLPLERVIGWVITEQPRLAAPVFGDIVRRARQELNLSDDTIKEALHNAARWGVTHDEEESVALEEFLRLTLPPSLNP